MPETQMTDAVFTKPATPKNSGQLLRWLVFEPGLLRKYSATLSCKQALWELLKAYPLVVACCCLLYLLSNATIIGFDLPHLFPGQWTELLGRFSGQHSFFDSYTLFIKETVLEFTVGLAFGLVVGLVWGSAWGLAFGLAADLLWVVAGGFGWGVAGGLAWGLVLGLGFYIACFSLLSYPFGFLKIDFYRAPYLHDDGMWCAGTRLRALALEDPETAVKFVAFLRAYRPSQSELADAVFHAAYAGRLCLFPLDPRALAHPISITNDKLKPSADWNRRLEAVRTGLDSYTNHDNIHLEQQSCQQLIAELNAFKQQTLSENLSWRGYYLTAIDKWLTAANEKLLELGPQANTLEPITANVYLSCDALNLGQHRAIFFGRDDLKDQLARSILTATKLPMLLIQGQRCTGKTSLLSFFEPLLGSGFKVLRQDVQAAQFDSIPQWLADLQRGIGGRLQASRPDPSHNASWLQCWQAVQNCLEQFVGDRYHLVLAFDGYEAIHGLLKQDPTQGERLLAAMRAYSQRQNNVVFLFVGEVLFSELEQPSWSRCFVQVERFRVDYLRHDDAIRLITEPVKLSYPPAVCERMFELTQGHPALLQLLCSKMVDIANRENRKTMQAADLDTVVQAVSTERETLAILVFWRDFCADPACKQTVKMLLNGEAVTPNSHLYRLEEHGFIVEKEGRWQLRIPLFEMWLKRFADRV